MLTPGQHQANSTRNRRRVRAYEQPLPRSISNLIVLYSRYLWKMKIIQWSILLSLKPSNYSRTGIEGTGWSIRSGNKKRIDIKAGWDVTRTQPISGIPFSLELDFILLFFSFCFVFGLYSQFILSFFGTLVNLCCFLSMHQLSILILLLLVTVSAYVKYFVTLLRTNSSA